MTGAAIPALDVVQEQERSICPLLLRYYHLLGA